MRAVAGGAAAGPRRAADLAAVEPAEPRGAPLPHPGPHHPARVDQPRHQPRPLGRQPAVGLLRKILSVISIYTVDKSRYFRL